MQELVETNVADYRERATRLFEERKINTDRLEVREENGRVYLYISYNYQAYFGRVLGIQSYGVDISLVGYIENDRLIIAEVDPEDVFANW
jgi:hypothetical protein